MQTRREALLDLIVRWEDAGARGQHASPEEVCRDCPELADEFRGAVEQLRQVDWLNAPIEATTPAIVPPPPGDAVPALPRMMAGRYRLDALIGEGGFGRVYRSFDTWLERPVALKVPRVDRPVTGGAIDLCRLEARKVARLKHPNIVPVHDVGRDGGTCFIVSEWIDGEDLATRLKSGLPPQRESATVVAEVAEALAHAHQHGFVHRDIKPANILLDGQGRAYLTDFGIAVVEEELLRDAPAAGTIVYMAPEQLVAGLGPVDHRADIYSLGVVFYELLSGRRPFPAKSPIALRNQVLGGDPPPLSALGVEVAAELERICLHCLATRPEQRSQRADALGRELRAYLGS